jgi:hypothetical protein
MVRNICFLPGYHQYTQSFDEGKEYQVFCFYWDKLTGKANSNLKHWPGNLFQQKSFSIDVSVECSTFQVFLQETSLVSLLLLLGSKLVTLEFPGFLLGNFGWFEAFERLARELV